MGQMEMGGSRQVPRATYRVQFNRGFTFQQATEAAEYLRDLGISDCYASPIFQAGAESTHGYDICAFDQINSNLGTAADFERFTIRLSELGLGLVLDIVPNHMRADSANRWWRDVLEKGRASRFASFFDIEWGAAGQSSGAKIVLPVLEDDYGRVLEAGKLRLAFGGGRFSIRYYENEFPLSAESQTSLVEQGPEQALERLNGKPGVRGSFEKLDELLEQQHYRLVCWRAASEEINYRRFFDVTELVALRMELPEMFEAVHGLVFELVRAGKVAGLRVDHPDGLWDPGQYFERLKAGVQSLAEVQSPKSKVQSRTEVQSSKFKVQSSRSEAATGPGIYVVAEKILCGEEVLRTDWPIEGTTGYDFLNQVNGLFVNGDNREALDRVYGEFTGRRWDFKEAAYAGKKKMVRLSFGGELRRLSERLMDIAREMGADFDFDQVQWALAEIIAAFPVYRTYTTERTAEVPAAEREYIERAVGEARRRNQKMAGAVFDFITAILLLRVRQEAEEPFREPSAKTSPLTPALSPSEGERENRRRSVPDGKSIIAMGAATREEAIQQQCREFVMRFQQLTAPVMAKGLEDSAFYNFNRLISLNEVGGDPDCFGVGVEEFHRDNLARAERWPHSMLATSTHDTKRGEDARARINVLSEVPEEWGEAVRRWRGMNEKSVVDGEPAPCPNDEYLLYQTLIGVWPMEADWVGGGGALDGPKVESRPLTPALSPSEGERERLRLDAAAGRGMAGALSPSEGGAEKLGQPVCGGAEEERGAAGKAALRERVSAYMLKAIREAKTHTSWTEANLSYEKATVQFVEKILDDSRANQFLEDFGAFQRRIAFFGVINSLAQTLLKLTCPGVPDFYQGTELWDFSLVDPDNRRPVDYQLRRRILEMVRSKVQNPKLPHASRFWVEMGAIKLRLIWQALDFRRRHPEVFEKGAYVPLLASGSKAGHVCAFARVLGKETVVAVAPRLVVGLTGGLERWPLKDEIWLDTEVELPSGTKARGFANALTGERVRVENGAKGSRLRVGELLESLPVALMHEQG